MRVTIFLILILSITALATGQPAFPPDHKDLKEPISFETMTTFLDEVKQLDHITVTREGTSAAGNPLFLVHIRTGSEPTWRLFFVGQQHGNEPAGKDALIYLIRDLAENPQNLPEDVDLWIVPMANPDGAIANERRNGNNADLNRDHLTLSQPETQTLHQLYRQIMPHVAVDCHEFTRDSSDYGDRGWDEWPLIMMDTANHPLYPDALYEAGLRWIDKAGVALAEKGHNYRRYMVGDPPPEGELRHSTLDPDDARNGFGIYGGLSFIIESGIKRGADDPYADLHQRVDAYLTIFEQFIHDERDRAAEIEQVQQGRAQKLPPFIPTNFFWGNVGQQIHNVKVIDQQTGQVQEIPMANFMEQRIVKRSVATPRGYAIDARQAALFEELLQHHDIGYEKLKSPMTLLAEASYLLRTEDEYDDVYNRYAGRQIVETKSAASHEFSDGTLLVRLEGLDQLRAALLLEPNMMFGLYQFPEYANIVGEDGLLPVWRVQEIVDGP